MILYVNGDSHAAAAECVNAHAWAQDDGMYYGLGQQPHPDNERASFGCELANWLNAILYLDAQAGGSNTRIVRTTREWLQHQDNVKDIFVVLQWSTWEREEWQDEDGTYFQVNASGIDDVPDNMKLRYQNFVIDVDWKVCTQTWHEKIWEFHQELKAAGVRHLMFNGNSHFAGLDQKDWGNCYIDPYDSTKTYTNVLKNAGFSTVNPNSWHFGAEAHCFWGEYLLHYIKNNNLLDSNEISAY